MLGAGAPAGRFGRSNPSRQIGLFRSVGFLSNQGVVFLSRARTGKGTPSRRPSSPAAPRSDTQLAPPARRPGRRLELTARRLGRPLERHGCSSATQLIQVRSPPRPPVGAAPRSGTQLAPTARCPRCSSECHGCSSASPMIGSSKNLRCPVVAFSRVSRSK